MLCCWLRTGESKDSPFLFHICFLYCTKFKHHGKKNLLRNPSLQRPQLVNTLEVQSQIHTYRNTYEMVKKSVLYVFRYTLTSSCGDMLEGTVSATLKSRHSTSRAALSASKKLASMLNKRNYSLKGSRLRLTHVVDEAQIVTT